MGNLSRLVGVYPFNVDKRYSLDRIKPSMATESSFVEAAYEVAAGCLSEPFSVVRGAPLLYEIKVSNKLEVMDLAQVRKPKRGTSAFQTDLCVFERKSDEVCIPRVVIEFKTTFTTHDILTYSAKALRHKRIYPYLRYGMLASNESFVPGRAFTHNEALDFFASVKGLSEPNFKEFFSDLLREELAASELLEEIAYGKVRTRLFRARPMVYMNAVYRLRIDRAKPRSIRLLDEPGQSASVRAPRYCKYVRRNQPQELRWGGRQGDCTHLDAPDLREP